VAALAGIRARRVDTAVVYKVDRLTRSLTNFAKRVEPFDAHGVSFVSVTQAFNTTNSMGRLTLNVLLSFAQFEREVIAERVRDKVAASKRKGMWMGGGVPLGYINRDKKLIIVPEEAETVRWIFRTYQEVGSIGCLLQKMDDEQVRSKRREPGDGRGAGGCRFGPGSLGYLKELEFPECTARVMGAERTFWEKATAIHVFCLQSKLNGER
jgi:site-specific DNA recombinase